MDYPAVINNCDGDTIQVVVILAEEIADYNISGPFEIINENLNGFSLVFDVVYEGDEGVVEVHLIGESGCETTIEISVEDCFQPCDEDYFFGQEDIVVQTTNCTDSGCAEICLDIQIDEIFDYSVLVDGQDYDQLFGMCAVDSSGSYSYELLISLNLEDGPFVINSWTVNGNVFSGAAADLPELVDSMNVWDPTGNWMLSPSGPFIVGGDELSSYGEMHLEIPVVGAMAILRYNVAIISANATVKIGNGEHEIIITNNETDCADTLYVEGVCTTADTLWVEVEVNGDTIICFDTGELPGNVMSLESFCDAGDNAGVTILNDTCIQIDGLVVGQDTACFIMCDDLGICDTIYVYIEVVPEVIVPGGDITVTDSVLINVDTVIYCIDPNCVDGDIVSIEDICTDSNGDNVQFTVDPNTWCITYTGFELGIDTACFKVTGDAGDMKVVTMIITVVPPTPEYYDDTIPVGAEVIYCLDTTELAGDVVTIYNICPDGSAGEVLFTTMNGIWFVMYEGIEEGKDTACIVICDEYDVCDTTYMCISVDNNGQNTPIAADDCQEVVKELQEIEIDVLSNDMVNGSLQSLFITQNPIHGTAVQLQQILRFRIPHLRYAM